MDAETMKLITQFRFVLDQKQAAIRSLGWPVLVAMYGEIYERGVAEFLAEFKAKSDAPHYIKLRRVVDDMVLCSIVQAVLAIYDEKEIE